MGDPRIAEIAARVAAAPGTTEIVRHDNAGGEIMWQVCIHGRDARGRRTQIIFGESDLSGPWVRRWAELFANAPADLAFLLAHADAQDAEIAALRAAVERIARNPPGHGPGYAGPCLCRWCELWRIAGLTEARPAERTHHADCWRYHPGCAVARLEAVAEVRAGLVERGERCRLLERESSHHEARRLAAKAATYEHAADLLGKALEG